MRTLELVACVLVIAWLVVLVVTWALIVVTTWDELWRRLDELARTRRRWWGP